MLSLVICLLPLAASVPVEVGTETSKNLIVSIDNGTLKDVRFVGNSDRAELNLSGLPDLRALEKNAFDNVLDVESLVLANNSLTSLPEFVFSNLTKLKSLSLSDNQISNVRNLFVGLESLQLLDISRNPIRHFGRGHLFGLTKSARILTDGNILWSISTGVFANSFLKDAEKMKRLAAMQDQSRPAKENEEKDRKVDETEVAKESQNEKIVETLSERTRVKICKSDGIVTSLEILLKDEELVEGCIQVLVDTAMRVNLAELGIKSFQEDWYRLQSLPIASLDLSNNEIVEITKEMLNDLPSSLTYVNFQGNKIRMIWSQVIKNDHLNVLNLRNNLIEEIEEDALAKTNLRELYLAGNQLKNLNFVSSLPDTLTVFLADRNHIISIPDGVFSKFFRLNYLHLDDNKIETLQKDVFQGLSSLLMLTLVGNGIKTIEPNAFRGLTTLQTLDLRRNSIRDLRKGILATLTGLRELNLANNKIAKATFADLAESVEYLYLDYNEIDILEEDNFVQAPTSTLSLTGNRISSIMRGSLNLPTLRDLHLNNNTLTTIEGDSYEGLSRLRRLWLSENKISEIHKGACKNLGSLYILDISRNPFQKLENGALNGLNTAFGTSVYIYENDLKEIQGGVFDDV